MYVYNLKDKKGEYKLNIIEKDSDIEISLENQKLKKIKNKLRYWFKNYYEKKNYSCGNFLYFMIHSKNVKDNKHWKVIYSKKESEYVLLKDDNDKENKNKYHFALYLPELDKYLSQFGNGGLIVLSNLDEMHRFFDTNSLYFLETLFPI
jgi:hypothetical protein